MQNFKNIRQKFEIEMRCECHEFRRNFSKKFEHIIFDRKISIMSTNNEKYENFV